jgi:hypothetical protein
MSRIFTMAALAEKSVPQLQALFRKETLALTQTAPMTNDRRIALANLETIERVLAARYASGIGL